MSKVIDIDRAVRLNRQSRDRLGWGAHIGAIARAIGYTGPISDEKQFSKALASWQEVQGLEVDGAMGPITWGRLRNLLTLPPASGAGSQSADVPGSLGTLVTTAAGRAPVAYRFTRDDLIWTAKLLVHESGGEEDAENAAVLWAMLNRYALFTRTVFPSFAGFVRAYSTTLQPVLLNSRAAQAHVATSQFVPSGGVYPGTNIPRGQLRRHLDIQRAPWSSIKLSARRLALLALQGGLPNPGIGNASDFASTRIFFRRRNKRDPSPEEWRHFTEAYAASKKRRWVGEVPGINQMKNAFFLDLRVANLPAGAVRVSPSPSLPVTSGDGVVPERTPAAGSTGGTGSTTRPTSPGVSIPAAADRSGSPVSPPVAKPCVDVPMITGPPRAITAVADTTRFAGLSDVAVFAQGLSNCYAARMAERRARERHAEAQRQAERVAGAQRVPRETKTAKAERVARARAAVAPQSVDAVRADIRNQFRAFLEADFADTIKAAPKRRKYRTSTVQDISRQWMFGRREQVDFITLGTPGQPLRGFAPPPRPAGGDQLVDIEPPATTDGGAKVQPLLNQFLRELRKRHPRHSASTYPKHGGGAFDDRGYSVDIFLPGATDDRGFYPRPASFALLHAVADAASTLGVEWRAIYNDHAVAVAVNSRTGRKHVVFVGTSRRGTSIALNWHGPLILHFHLDIAPRI